MKPIKLEMSGFGPFKERQVVNFKDDIFLITGPTGSGKSTIFNAILVSLYGSNNLSLKLFDLVNSEKDSAQIIFTFEHNNDEYTIIREIKEKKNKTELQLPSGEIITSSEKTTDYIKNLLGIDAKQFKQIVLLPQGKFQELLLANPTQKQEIFRAIFDTSLYELFQNKFKTFKKSKEDELRKYTDELNILQQHLDNLDIDIVKIEQDISELDKKEKDINKNLELKRKIKNEYLQINKDIQSKEQYISELEKLDITENNFETIKNQIAKLSYVDSLQVLEQRKEDIQNKLEKLLSKKEHYEKILKNYQNQKEEIESKKQLAKKLEAEIEDNNNQLYKLTKNLDDLKNYHKLLENRLQNKLLNNNLLSIEKKIENLQIQISDFEQNHKEVNYNDQLDKLNSLKNDMISLKELDYKIIKCNKKLNEISLVKEKQYISYLQEKLKPNCPCPVCGSTIHNNIKIDKTENNNYFENLVKAEKNLNEQLIQLKIDRSAKQKHLLDNNYQDIETIDKEIEKINHLNQQYSQKQDIYEENQKQLKQLETETTKIKREVDSLNGEINVYQKIIDEQSFIDINLDNIETNLTHRNNDINQLNNTININKQNLQQLKDEFLTYDKDYKLAQNNYENSKLNYQEQDKEFLKADEEYQKKLKANFLNIKEYQSLKSLLPKQKYLENKLNKYQKINNFIQALEQKIGHSTYHDTKTIENEIKQLDNDKTKISETKGKLLEQYNAYNNMEPKIEKLKKDISKLHPLVNNIVKIDDVINNNNKNSLSFEKFVQLQYLDQILIKANQILYKLTNGRYQLIRSDFGFNFEILDGYHGIKRNIKTLSGGETFKASLALALGISNYISEMTSCQNINMLFIDEGFGTLDYESLEQVLNIFDELQQESGRMIGLISHIDLLKDRIYNQINIQSNDGISQIINNS